jgi:hypothetical protein
LTERDYVYDLKLFIELYLYPLRTEKSITAEDLADLFVNVEELLPVNQKLLDKFISLKEPTAIQVAEALESVVRHQKPQQTPLGPSLNFSTWCSWKNLDYTLNIVLDKIRSFTS